MLRQTLRIIDANCNRIGEGLRFLEDIARFALNDSKLGQKIKSIRHELTNSLSHLGISMMSYRDVSGDVGKDKGPIGYQKDLLSLLKANSKRVEEALRVIEELAKLPELNQMLVSKHFETTRFHIYSIEKELLSKLTRHDKTQYIAGLYVIIDTHLLSQSNLTDMAAKVIRGGASVIQLRDKQKEKGELLNIASDIACLCHETCKLFIMNDHLDIAIAVNADGIHIGQGDLPLSVIRKELPIDKIIGVSTHTLEEAKKAQDDGADYIAVGSLFQSSTKPDAKVIGLKKLKVIRNKIFLPIVAIGGIKERNIGEIMASGVEASAVISAVLSDEDPENATRRLVKEIEQNR